MIARLVYCMLRPFRRRLPVHLLAEYLVTYNAPRCYYQNDPR